MPYNNITTRTDAAALIPEEVANVLLQRAADDSAALTLFRRVPIARGQVRVPVLSALPIAYFVNGDTGLKQTSEINWANKYINVEEIATIIPIPDNVVDDMDVNVWDEAYPYLVEAAGRCLDAAVFFGTNAPASWPTNVSAAAAAAGNTVAESLAASAGGFFGDFDAALALVEADGFDSNGVVAARNARGKFRAARSTTGDRLDGDRVAGNLSEIDGMPIVYPMRGLFPSTVRLLVGAWDEFVLGVRKDITIDVFREGVIQDNTGAIIYNLMQQDMTAVRLTFRVGWQVSNNINYDQPTEGSRYPVARLTY